MHRSANRPTGASPYFTRTTSRSARAEASAKPRAPRQRYGGSRRQRWFPARPRAGCGSPPRKCPSSSISKTGATATSTTSLPVALPPRPESARGGPKPQGPARRGNNSSRNLMASACPSPEILGSRYGGVLSQGLFEQPLRLCDNASCMSALYRGPAQVCKARLSLPHPLHWRDSCTSLMGSSHRLRSDRWPSS